VRLGRPYWWSHQPHRIQTGRFCRQPGAALTRKPPRSSKRRESGTVRRLGGRVPQYGGTPVFGSSVSPGIVFFRFYTKLICAHFFTSCCSRRLGEWGCRNAWVTRYVSSNQRGREPCLEFYQSPVF
jgi:hypothetical protein